MPALAFLDDLRQADPIVTGILVFVVAALAIAYVIQKKLVRPAAPPPTSRRRRR
jgi:hypothetical protein